ncbi:hypothetical protein Q1695_007884 [Nippostrongylus brasiliensis]|nr:hypothetical protein Q1695_007884 [Nippostrongylus brasiliensis]
MSYIPLLLMTVTFGIVTYGQLFPPPLGGGIVENIQEVGPFGGGVSFSEAIGPMGGVSIQEQIRPPFVGGGFGGPFGGPFGRFFRHVHPTPKD